MLLQENLPLEFKESGTLHGRFLEGNLKLGRLLLNEEIEKKEKKKMRKEIGEFSFSGADFRFWEVRYICERGC